MEASEVLRRAADYIDEHGWIQGSFGVGIGPVCAIGAINSVTGHKPDDGFPDQGYRLDSVAKLYDHLGLDSPWKDGFGIGNAVAIWNDRKETTAHEVTAAMRAAADG